MMTVWCTFAFEDFHRWPGAPDDVAFLRDRHRHIFEFRVEVVVEDSDRAVEFIMLKREAEILAKKARANGIDQEAWSCERWAMELASELAAVGYAVAGVTVSEDGENGATLRLV